MNHVLALDLGTTGNRAIVVNSQGTIIASAYRELRQLYPNAGWVEHDPMDIWQAVQDTIAEVKSKLGSITIDAIGITNQRETVVVWNKYTGIPIANAIVWQCRRTASRCNDLTDYGSMIRLKTGLILDAYFSATKIEWLLSRYTGNRDDLMTGTIDSWILYCLSDKQIHATDPSNASRTMLWNITTHQWDTDLLSLFNIPLSMMPTVNPSNFKYPISPRFGSYVTGILGDQQASLFAQCSGRLDSAKLTYGTGLFAMAPISELSIPDDQYLTTVGWQIDSDIYYAREGSVFVGGALVQWLRDGLGIIQSADEIEALANSVASSDGVVIVPAFTGLGAPHWDSSARGLIIGLTRSTTRAHIARAALEAIALQANDIIRDLAPGISALNVDGGASKNNTLMQWQATLSQLTVIRPSVTESTALGVAMLAGIGAGLWDHSTAAKMVKTDQTFVPESENLSMVTQWEKAVGRARGWV